MPFVLIPQVWSPPALTDVKVPAGGVDWPEPLSPQQATVPSSAPRRCGWPPALTAVKVPAGGVPGRSRCAPAGERAVVLHAAGVEPPALTAVKVPAGGVAWPVLLAPAGDGAVVDAAGVVAPALTAVKVPAGGVAWP